MSGGASIVPSAPESMFSSVNNKSMTIAQRESGYRSLANQSTGFIHSEVNTLNLKSYWKLPKFKNAERSALTLIIKYVALKWLVKYYIIRRDSLVRRKIGAIFGLYTFITINFKISDLPDGQTSPENAIYRYPLSFSIS